ncbi:OmpW family protein [Hansschlegelia zhihuaiae]|uniref:OmpW family protein n=1 Tax=Hansschlegelia zhihuaiae TaxID=405005 RepID=A0A4Q0MI47_9HYPH|nr:OmpW family protein [Hansschlegelia zhihuaiae]RXF73220.1 OmpW family protein [Hansschlegelia zhihuaiae]
MIAGTLSVLAAVTATPAAAADIPSETPAVAAAPADFNPWMLRVRAIGILPNSSAKFNVPGSAHVSDRVVPEIDVSYFFTPNIAIETICCFSKHKISGRGALAGVAVGDVWVLPATVMAQYHFTNFGAFRPYAGVGLNYSIYFREDAAGGAVTRLKLKNSFGPAAQVGFDYMLNEHWGVNVDLKYVRMKPKIDLVAGGADVSGRAKISPWIVGAGVAYKF